MIFSLPFEYFLPRPGFYIRPLLGMYAGALGAKLATSIAKPVLSHCKLLFPPLINMGTAVHTVARTFTALAPTATAPTSSCSSLTKFRYPSTKSIEKVAFIASRGHLAARKPSLLSRNVFRSFAVRAAGTIAVGDSLPEAELSYFDKDGDVQTVKVSELTKGKKVVIFAVPGAFTPTCSSQHLPGFVAKADELRKAGVETLACVSVNDAFVMKAWGESIGVDDKVLMLSDGLGKFTEALGTQVDLSDKPVGLGVRSRRFSMLVEDGKVRTLNLEEGGAFTNSSAEEILKSLQKAAA